ncbi:PQQ-dependent sugar dehydrogenase [uncultured Piscinibacter sp.]|uniref:PQQ-dependent sugar dehydrogenase n=1 Tax=uncultured Piscinibacter sp. TaxID=1131835 RepID=UPI00261B74C8|nr:PQQ-dependent sugar dehydrogenase [uncultured Piscinibacter sp.]
MRRLIAFLLVALAWGAAGAQALRPVPVVTGLDHPWALAFLPDGRMLVTEKPGRLRIARADGRVGAPLSGLPAVDGGGQCGLLDVAVDPDFANNGLVFWTFAEPGDGGNSTAVARGRLVGDRLVEVRTIFSQRPKVTSRHHCGSRIVFGRDGTLWVGLGDRFSRKEDAQNPANHLGKVVRIDREGRPPADNPKFAAPEVWSLGHRNIQGAAAHPVSGELWTLEHGPQGGDEVNAPKGGRNYGWPLVTRGRNYVVGTRIGEDGPKPGYEEPLKVWVPSIAPSGMAFLTSERYPGWKGSLFVGALKARVLVRLGLDGGRVIAEERLLEDLGERIRDVRQGPDGWLYLVTDGSDGRVLRLER